MAALATQPCRIIPSLLLRKGRLVKGIQFVGHRDAGAPATTARAHSAQGADEIVLLDIDSARTGSEPDFEALEKVADEVQIPLTFGGALTSVDRMHRAIAGGADKICLTSAALADPSLIDQGARRFGAQAIMLGIDCKDGFVFDHVAQRVRRDTTPEAWAREATERGAGEIRLCAVEREGTRRGLDIELYRRVRAMVNVPIVLEGGIGTLEQIAEAMRAGADSVALGTLLVFTDANLVKIRRYLQNAGIMVRP